MKPFQPIPGIIGRLAAAFMLTVLVTITVVGSVSALDYPKKVIRLVVPFAAGGGTDVIARQLAARMYESLKSPIIVDNRPGANGIIGSGIVANAPPDGYTLLFVSSPHSVNPSMYPKQIRYDTLRDFSPIAQAATSGYILVAHPSLGVRTVKELVELAKTRPDQIDYASGGSGSSAHLAAELFNQMAGVRLREIPYKGAGPALISVVSGHTPLVFANMLTVKPHIESQRVFALGIASLKRSAALPDIPTIAESGVPGFSADAILGMLAPAKTPRPIIDMLNAEIHKAMRSPEMVAAMKNVGVEEALSTPEEFGRTIESEMNRWGKLVRSLNLRLE